MSSKKSKQDKLRRILSLILVIIMLVSVCATGIYYFAYSLSAEEATEEEIDTEDTEAVDTEAAEDELLEDESDRDEDVEDEYISSDFNAEDKLIRVGLMYGTNVTVGFETTTKYGFTVNKVNRTDDLTSEPLWNIDLTKVSCTVDDNLTKSGMTYSKTASAANTVIGGWHVEIGNDLTYDEAIFLTEELESILSPMGLYPIPSYIKGGYRIRVGHYFNKASAESDAMKIAETTGLDVNIANPTHTAVSLVDPLTDRILFEYDDRDETAFGITANASPDGETEYLVTPAKKSYDGVFMFRRYISGSTDGVSLTNILPLNEYVKGVLPYEISSSWPLEAQKAFAIIVRSFTMAGTRHESAYQVDLCNTTHCQVYGGRTKVTPTVEQAVDETGDLVMTYDGKIVTAYYSAVTGGTTVGVNEAWGGSAQPYLVAVETPWEIFTNHSNGTWKAEVSPAELADHLRSKGYTSLKGSITDISVDKLATNSTYVYQITFTDSYGTKATIKTTDKIRSTLSGYVKSANFVVGKGSVVADETTFLTIPVESLNIITETGTDSIGDVKKATVLTADGIVEADLNESKIITESGVFNPGSTTAITESTTVYAQNSGNYIFVGKGWGHGVGASQIGIRDLANLGYKGVDILGKYFTDIEIRDWQEVK